MKVLKHPGFVLRWVIHHGTSVMKCSNAICPANEGICNMAVGQNRATLVDPENKRISLNLWWFAGRGFDSQLFICRMDLYSACELVLATFPTTPTAEDTTSFLSSHLAAGSASCQGWRLPRVPANHALKD